MVSHMFGIWDKQLNDWARLFDCGNTDWFSRFPELDNVYLIFKYREQAERAYEALLRPYTAFEVRELGRPTS